MSNFNIKKSFVWKYGLSKLHKKKAGEETEPECEPPADDASSCCSLEPDLALQPQWEPLVPAGTLWTQQPADPAIPEKRRSLDPPTTAAPDPPTTAAPDPPAAAAAAALPGYAVAGCRRLSVDGELPIYESLSEYGGGALADDQQTLYENDDTDEELAPLYENGSLQPIYANGDVVEEAPIYENLFEEETVIARKPAAGKDEVTYDALRVEVRSDHGYDSYQSPSSGSSGSPGSSGASSGSRRSSGLTASPRSSPKHSSNMGLGHLGDNESELVLDPVSKPVMEPMLKTASELVSEVTLRKEREVSEPISDTVSEPDSKVASNPLQAASKATSEQVSRPALEHLSRTAPKPVSETDSKTCPVATSKPVLETSEPKVGCSSVGAGQPLSLTEILSADSLVSAKQSLKPSRVMNVLRPIAVKQTKAQTTAAGEGEQSGYQVEGGDKNRWSKSEPNAELRSLKVNQDGWTCGQQVGKVVEDSTSNAPSSLPFLSQEKTKSGLDDLSLLRKPKQNPSFLHNGRSVGKLGDNASLQLARKAIAQALHRRAAPPDTSGQQRPKPASSVSLNSSRPDLTMPVERVAVTPGVIPPPPPLPGLKLTSPIQPSPTAAKATPTQALQSGLKKKLEAKKSSMAADKLPTKKKRMAPKPPDRSLSLPGFGSSKADIAKAFEEYKRKEEQREHDERSRKQRNSFLDELDLKVSKKLSLKSNKAKVTVITTKEEPTSESGMNTPAAKKGCLGSHLWDSSGSGELDLMQSMPVLKTTACKPATQRISKREAREAKKKRQSPRIPSSLINASFQQRHDKADALPDRVSRSESIVEPTRSYEAVRDSTEITVLERIEPIPASQKSCAVDADTDFRVASLVTPCVRSTGGDRRLAAADDWVSAGDVLHPPVDCCVTVGGLQVIRISPEGDTSDSPSGAAAAAISLTVTAEPPAQTAAAPTDRVALQVPHGRYHSSVVQVGPAQTWDDDGDECLVVASLPVTARASPGAPRSARPGTLSGTPSDSLPGDLPDGEADMVTPLVISVSEVERQFELLERGHHWRDGEPESESESDPELEEGGQELEQEPEWTEEKEEEVTAVQLRHRRRRYAASNRQRDSRDDELVLLPPKSVEALSIIANKQKTKHFLENRIQADLAAGSGGSGTTSSPVDSSHSSALGAAQIASRCPRMAAATAPCPAAGCDDPGSAPAAAGWRRSVGGTAPEARIVREIRELRCREEELRRLRPLAGPTSPSHEEPLSGYGSEDKDSLAEEADSSGRDASSRPLSRSQESLSSGHSSGLGSDHAAEMAGRRRVTVRPYEDQEDGQQWTSFARSAETPIEREIRLTREREEERRLEQALRAPKTAPGSGVRPQAARTSVPTTTPTRRPAPTPTPTAASTDDRRQAALRLATGRVQHEIQEATRRELELRGEGHLITTSEETVDDKVTRPGQLTEHNRQLVQSRQQKAESAPQPKPAASRPTGRAPPVAPPTTTAGPRPQPPTFRPAGAGAGRGLMQKFISSRGKLRTAGAFTAAPAPSPPSARVTSRPEPAGRQPSRPAAPSASRSGAAPVQRRLLTSWSLDNPAISAGTQGADRRGPSATGSRRLLTAEEKIQMELKVMKEREDELRRQRGWALARSQPDLLAALNESDHGDDDEGEDTVPPPAPLTRTMSNPSLLDDQEQALSAAEMFGGPSHGRRRSVLIDQWESRIQGTET